VQDVSVVEICGVSVCLGWTWIELNWTGLGLASTRLRLNWTGGR